MLHTPRTVLTFHNVFNLSRIVNIVFNITGTCGLVGGRVIASAACKGRGRHGSVAAIHQHGVPGTRSLHLSTPVLHLTCIVYIVVVGFDDAAVLSREGAVALSIGSLLGDEHRVFRVTEVVVLYKRRTAHGHTNAVF